MKKILLSSLGSLLAGALIAQVPVSKNTEKKIPVLEDLTGVNCYWCPDGAKVADNMKAARGGDLIIVANHEGPYATSAWETPEGALVGSQSNAAGYPNGNVSRRVFSGNSTAHGRGSWDTNAKTIESEDTPVNLGLEAFYKKGTSEMEIYVTSYWTADGTGDEALNIAILQDSIIAAQSGAGDLYPARVDPGSGLFIHLDVLRDYVTTVKFGAPNGFTSGDVMVNTNKNDMHTYEYTWTIPAKIGGFDVVAKDLKVIAFVTENDGWSEILTGTEYHVYEKDPATAPVGIEEKTSLENWTVFPNPFTTTASVQFNLNEAAQLRVNVYDITGKVVQEFPTTTYSAGMTTLEVDGSNLESGLYYVSVVADGAVMTQKLILNK